jgi:ribonucleotide monophosphatase NagD (HAD superfamily)
LFRLDTDIKFGINGGLTTLLALSGITKEEVLNNQADINPDFVVDSLADLYTKN